MGIGKRVALGWTLARRELRGGIRSLRIVLACLALGVAAIAAVGTLRAGIAAGLAADGARILGGDVERVKSYGVTFGGVFFPGETMRIRVWEDDNRLLVAATAVEREDAPVLKNVVVGLA